MEPRMYRVRGGWLSMVWAGARDINGIGWGNATAYFSKQGMRGAR